MAPMSKEKKPSRITVACNACRSRKQKCSGEKPVCEQCYEYNRPCDWPEQLRRGPAKGYIETLEHRLRVTESVLLRLLCHVSNAQLSAALPQDLQLDRGVTTYTPFSRLEKKGIEDWSEYPLDTPVNIRRWQQACMGQRSGCSAGEVDSFHVYQEQHEKQDSRKRHLESSSCPEYIGQEQGEGYGHGSRLEQDAALQSSPSSNPTIPIASPTDRQHQANPFPKNTSCFQPDTGRRIYAEPFQTAPNLSSWHEAPSFSFQQQFLW